ncbi:GPW/gp25 family protein [Kribbella sp. NBC_01510]|uniref:GPW/gp25 family protein n=1 Tax=Kribbella sp. NBC_01510 TaxID=2903581 RepID=UPI00386B780E
MMAGELLGRGLAFPLQIGATGLGEAAGVAKVEDSIRIILGTQYGERLMRPRFGANLKSLIFAPNNATTASLAGYYVSDALTRWEPRIEVLDVLVTNDLDRGILVIEIRYQLRATAQEHQLVYPFPLERA